MFKKKKSPEPKEYTFLIVCSAHREEHPSVDANALSEAQAISATDQVDVDWETFRRSRVVKEGELVSPVGKPMQLGSALWAVEYAFTATPREVKS